MNTDRVHCLKFIKVKLYQVKSHKLFYSNSSISVTLHSACSVSESLITE